MYSRLGIDTELKEPEIIGNKFYIYLMATQELLTTIMLIQISENKQV